MQLAAPPVPADPVDELAEDVDEEVVVDAEVVVDVDAPEVVAPDVDPALALLDAASVDAGALAELVAAPPAPRSQGAGTSNEQAPDTVARPSAARARRGKTGA